ncbi:FK506-binding protein 5 [Capsella rubella]|uniref:FK506-binding protein 5 n=1 Tax=Capsella rubella TaxID=81985 RepID=UPI000CD5A820|nr:FK506-binding protein 5 [Capsella rubella]
MGIDGKETIAILWKILGSSMSISINFMKNHPVLSGVSMFLLVLYIFLPSLLFFLIYSSPVLACALVYARERLGLRFSSLYSSSEPKSCRKGDKRCHLKQQRSVRRNARMKVEEWDSQTSEEEKDKVILTSLYNDLLGRTPHFEESPKASLVNEDNEEEKVVLGDHEEDSRDLSHLNVEESMVCNCEIKYEESSDGKEEMSNVNEHGISEIERNKRLESLIARRRARRLFRLALDQRSKLQAEETTSPRQNNNHHLHITVSRNSLEKRRNNSSDATTGTGLQVPGSAPSVMLQGRNPFDIPYDPQEERPNLTGDSFDQEFSLFNNHKDMFFCRHESFCRFALFSPEHAQCMNSPVSASDILTTRKRLDLDNEYMDHTEHMLPCNGKEVDTIEKYDKSVESTDSNKEEVEMNDETDSNKEEEDDHDSSCSEESEPELSRLNKAELREAICQSMDNYPGYLVNQTRNNIPSTLPKGLVAPRLDDHNMFYPRKCGNSHSRTFSVASDMQVEVSEIGSPPTTVDWLDDWSNGGESYMYDTDIDREIVRNEESRKRTSHQYESRSGIGSKEGNNEYEGAKPEANPDHNSMVDENLITVDDMSLLDDSNQTKDILEHKPSSSSDVSKPTSFGNFEGMLFHTSASLSSITEEPETILDSIDGGNSENMNNFTKELTDLRPLTTMDSSMKTLIDEEVVDMKQVVNDDLCGSPKAIELDIIDHQQKDQIMDIIQGEHESTKNLLDASLDTPCIESFEREVEEEEESRLVNFTEEITKQKENEEHQSDMKSSPRHVLSELQDNEVMGENGQELVKGIDEKAIPTEEEKTHNVMEESLSHPHAELVKDDENAEDKSDVILLQVQDNNKSPLEESTDKENSKEGEKSELLMESVVSDDTQKSQDPQLWAQQCGSDSSQGISPRTLEISQQLEQEDVIGSTTVSQDIDKDEFAAVANELAPVANELAPVANDLAASENNDEDNQKLYEQVEAMEKKIEHNLESLYNNIGIVPREDNEESKKMIGDMQNAETETTKDENRDLEE